MVKKTISDPIHHTIELTGEEVKILDTPAFQRLRGVKQLGLTHYVFPGADYSRFSHSLGVLHVTSRILEALKTYAGVELEEREIRSFRLAGMLHDIGHYPFSHATEHVAAEFYRRNLTEETDWRPSSEAEFADSAGSTEESTGELSLDELPTFVKHEDLGSTIVTSDPDIQKILTTSPLNLDGEEIANIFTKNNPGGKLRNLVKSDLDADRIDYLLRTAHFAGLPYGHVDLAYLLTQVLIDDNELVCLSEKVIRAADHLLLSRYLDYQQVPFNKTVVGFEWLLADLITYLLEQGLLNFEEAYVKNQVLSGEWHAIDDNHVMSIIRSVSNDTSHDKLVSMKAAAILNRRPPRILGTFEEFSSNATGDGARNHKTRLRNLAYLKQKIEEQYSLESNRIYIWSNDHLKLTGFASVTSTTPDKSGNEERDYTQEDAIHILPRNSSSKPIMSFSKSLMSVLSNYRPFDLRVYFFEGKDLTDLTPTLQQLVTAEMTKF